MDFTTENSEDSEATPISRYKDTGRFYKNHVLTWFSPKMIIFARKSQENWSFSDSKIHFCSRKPGFSLRKWTISNEEKAISTLQCQYLQKTAQYP